MWRSVNKYNSNSSRQENLTRNIRQQGERGSRAETFVSLFPPFNLIYFPVSATVFVVSLKKKIANDNVHH